VFATLIHTLAASCRRRLVRWQTAAALLVLAISLVLGGGLRARAAAIANATCLGCHADRSLTGTVGGREVSLAVDPQKFGKSVHGELSCTDCHADIKQVPHPERLAPVNCAPCHAGIAKLYATSIHGVSHAMGASAAATCHDCHGSHYIEPVKDFTSPVFKLNLPRTCAKCHSNPGITAEYRMKYPEVAAQYLDSIHGRALLQMGLIVAPSCNDCHGVHDIKRSVDRGSPINHANIAKTCGTCHLGVEKTYEQSVHGQLLARGDEREPVCIDCHTAHRIVNPLGDNFKRISDQRCGKCHADRLKYYRETYHGKAMELGRPNVAPQVAACYDCHGYHNILPPTDPRSLLAPENIVHTCRKCHPGATPNFTEYLTHANPLDATHYPVLHLAFVFMTTLLLGTFAFFGLHTGFWFFRSGYLYWHDSKRFRAAKGSIREGDEWFVRFIPFERFLHLLVVSSFLLLVITGMPLKFYYTAWAKVLVRFIGGADVARSLHHFGAIITFLYFGLHLGSLAGKSWKNRGKLRDPATGKLQLRRLWPALFGPDSLLPNMQDLRDFVAHNKWFFGKGPRPEFDRWTYWEKFDYFAVFWGVFMIGLSGLIMWFPQFFTKFLPGWVINIALIVHSDEALLAAGFIFTFHFFNTHFRLEKFPMDTVIFSGRVSKGELLHERKRWWDRLAATGRLDEYRVKDEWEGWKRIARGLGFTFFGLGLILLVLIIYAMISRLTH
jgi:cytochrome b subunit of formate dehydrogenase